jgi:thymidylate kinase
MTNAPFQALLVEGTSGVGKSTLIDALIRRHVSKAVPRKIRSLIHLAQSHTYGPLAAPEDRMTLTPAENRRHLERISGMLEWLHASVQEHTRPWCFVLIDALHITHCVRPGVVQWSDVEEFDQRLAALGCKLLFLKVSPATIWQRGIEPRKNEQFIQEYARKFGRTHEEIHRHFVKEQETLVELFARSVMPKLLLESESGPEDTLAAAEAFWTDGADSRRERQTA